MNTYTQLKKMKQRSFNQRPGFIRYVLSIVLLGALINGINAQSSGPPWPISLGVKGGFDQPLYLKDYNEVTYKGDLYYGAHIDYQSPNHWGIRLDYANIKNRTINEVPDMVEIRSLNGMNLTSVQKGALDIRREYIGIGPSVYIGDAKFYSLLAATAGYGTFKGGDAYAYAEPFFKLNHPDAQFGDIMENTGFDHKGIAAKLDLDFVFRVNDNWRISAGLYYMLHFNVPPDHSLDIGPGSGPMSILHYEGQINRTPSPPFLDVTQTPLSVSAAEVAHSSAGINIGINYRFGGGNKKIKEDVCVTCACPNDKHKLIVTVRDEPTGKVIPEADVVLKNMNGEIVATGTTNTYGVADLGEINHDNYTVIGNVFGIDTDIATITAIDFKEDEKIIRKEVLYTDLRFILKGTVTNKSTQRPEENTLVTLTNQSTASVGQDNSDNLGAFGFRLDPGSSYTVVGEKSGKLSDVEQASTIGLNRSATLFVGLELQVEDFNCASIATLDIKYDFDSAILTEAGKIELERLIQYFRSNSKNRIELSSHTDSRGKSDYNQQLSMRRANSAVQYIISRGVAREQITAIGHGESRLKNRCADGVNCAEEEHAINRRTEAKLICN